ncbi:MAG: type I restriction enzyme HsdR N-terminal domain-containing protein [Bacteroidales bacterium]|nr:type I restriction enzyme HsdR N-terminal domain-containing protein [Bacteroidales bacterium]
MIKLNLPEYHFKIKEVEGKKYIFDQNRKKYVALTPEEWVRQNFIQYLVNEKKYPLSLIGIEYPLKVHKLDRRGDIVVFNNQGKPGLIVECKAPDVQITQNVFDQIANYNIPLKVKYLIVTNGMKHYCCEMDYENKSYCFQKSIPEYNLIK